MLLQHILDNPYEKWILVESWNYLLSWYQFTNPNNQLQPAILCFPFGISIHPSNCNSTCPNEKRPSPKGKDRLPIIRFQVRTVSFREGNWYWYLVHVYIYIYSSSEPQCYIVFLGGVKKTFKLNYLDMVFVEGMPPPYSSNSDRYKFQICFRF